MNAPINVKFMVAKSIKHWTYPCIMCLQNLQKKCDLEEYVEKNNISEFSSILDVDTLGLFHTLLHTEEHNVKNGLFPYSVECLKRLYNSCVLLTGERASCIINSITEILNER